LRNLLTRIYLGKNGGDHGRNDAVRSASEMHVASKYLLQFLANLAKQGKWVLKYFCVWCDQLILSFLGGNVRSVH